MTAPFQHGSNEFSGVPIWVPLAGVRVFPTIPSLGIEVVKDALCHSCVHQQTFDLHAAITAPFLSWAAIDEKLVGLNRNRRSRMAERRPPTCEQQGRGLLQELSPVHCRLRVVCVAGRVGYKRRKGYSSPSVKSNRAK